MIQLRYWLANIWRMWLILIRTLGHLMHIDTCGMRQHCQHDQVSYCGVDIMSGVILKCQRGNLGISCLHRI